MSAIDLSRREAITLEQVLAEAPATARVDRKYLVPRTIAQDFVDTLPGEYRALEIDGRRSTGYHSTYFDTEDLATCRAHIQRRRRRWKFRSRLYLEDQFCRLEVKARDGSGMTHKYFHEIAPGAHGTVDGPALEFLARRLADLGFADVTRLVPTLEASYRRATLAAPGLALRVTVDDAVRCSSRGHLVELDPGYVIVETKGGVLPGGADRLLRDLGQRPAAFSKYAASLSLIDPTIADNDVRRLLGRQLHLRAAA
jgi:hypothetical protein